MCCSSYAKTGSHSASCAQAPAGNDKIPQTALDPGAGIQPHPKVDHNGHVKK